MHGAFNKIFQTCSIMFRNMSLFRRLLSQKPFRSSFSPLCSLQRVRKQIPGQRLPPQLLKDTQKDQQQHPEAQQVQPKSSQSSHIEAQTCRQQQHPERQPPEHLRRSQNHPLHTPFARSSPQTKAIEELRSKPAGTERHRFQPTSYSESSRN